MFSAHNHDHHTGHPNLCGQTNHCSSHTDGHAHPHRSCVLFQEMVGKKIHQLEQVKGQLRCPELTHAQLQVIRAEVALLTAGKDHVHSIKHALHAYYHAMGINHAALRNPYVVFGPVVAHKIAHLKLEMCKVKERLIRTVDSFNQQDLFTEAFRLAFHHLGTLIRDLGDHDLTVARLEHIKAEVTKVQSIIHQCKDHFYHMIGGIGSHIDPSILGMAEGLKMQWKRVKELVAKHELNIAHA